MSNTPKLFKTKGFYRVGQPLSLKSALHVVKMIRIKRDTTVLLSNAISDLKCSNHTDGFREHAKVLDKVVNVFKTNFGAGNVVLVTGPRMLPHRMECEEVIFKTAR